MADARANRIASVSRRRQSVAVSNTTPFHRITGVLGQRTYGTYAAGNALSLTGTWMQRIAVGWLAWELTGSAAWLGAVAFADLFPTVIVAPLAGAAADRWDRRRILRATVVVNLLQAAALALLSATGLLGIWGLLVATLIAGISPASASRRALHW